MLDQSNAQETKRFAIYTRYSSEMQGDISLEGQELMCRTAVEKRGGIVTAVYSDREQSGWSLNREGFMALRKAAEHGEFEAIMFWKFDRLARDYNHTLMIKLLLRYEYGINLYCVEGFSEDEDNSPYTILMEQMLAVFAAFYSKNLSTEAKRAKRYRAVNGEFNGSKPPLGYDLVLKSQATIERPAGLYINPEQAPLIQEAFQMYSSGNYSDAEIAQWLNRSEIIRNFRLGRKPVNKEMVRELLQNRVYTGQVRHTDTIYGRSDGGNRKASRHRGEWFEGKHKAIIDDDLFEACQRVRESLASHHFSTMPRRFVLYDRVYCARCLARKPFDLMDGNYGRMRAYQHKGKGY